VLWESYAELQREDMMFGPGLGGHENYGNWGPSCGALASKDGKSNHMRKIDQIHTVSRNCGARHDSRESPLGALGEKRPLLVSTRGSLDESRVFALE
jgi:hypothetical protein